MEPVVMSVRAGQSVFPARRVGEQSAEVIAERIVTSLGESLYIVVTE